MAKGAAHLVFRSRPGQLAFAAINKARAAVPNSPRGINMVPSRPSRLGWITVMLLGQQHGWASGQSTCATIAVSGVGDLDGTYTLDSSKSNPYYFRFGGNTNYEVYESNDAWWILDDRTEEGYRTLDLPLHPADIVDAWVTCTGSSYLLCTDDEAPSQPVITCTDPMPEPEPSTCANIAFSGVGDLDGTYELDSSISYPYYFRYGGNTNYNVYESNGAWWILDTRTEEGLRTLDPAQHPVDIDLQWVDCTGDSYLLCDYDVGLLQPNITCTDPIPEPEPSTCANIAFSGVGDLDGTYELDSSISYPYYFRYGGNTNYNVYESNGAWWILDTRTEEGLRTLDPAQHPVDIDLQWVDCTGDSYLLCDYDVGLLQPNITCTDPIPEPEPSTCASVIVSDLGDLDGTYDLDSSQSNPFYFRAGGTTTYNIYKSNGAWWMLDDGTNTGYRTLDPARHPVDIDLQWVDCTGSSSIYCDYDVALLQPNIICDPTAPTVPPTVSASPAPTTTAEEAIATHSPSPPSPTLAPENLLTPSPENPLTPSPVDPAPGAAPTETEPIASPVPATTEDDDVAEGTPAGSTNGDGSSGDDYAMELIIGVASTLASAAMIGFC